MSLTRIYVSVATPAAPAGYLVLAALASTGPEGWHWAHPALAMFLACAWLIGLGIARSTEALDRENELRSEQMRVTPDERAVVEAMRTEGGK